MFKCVAGAVVKCGWGVVRGKAGPKMFGPWNRQSTQQLCQVLSCLSVWKVCQTNEQTNVCQWFTMEVQE